MSNSCPQPEALRNYLTGKLPDAETEIVENHLANCQRCQVYLEILSEESDSLMQLVADAAAVPQLAGSNPIDTAFKQTGFVSHGQKDGSASARSGPGDSTYMIRDYRILECIGQGGMGSVYRALHIRLKLQRAVKILKSDRIVAPETISRFAREMEVVGKLKHPNIVQALDAGEHEGLPYFVMEFISGINLSQLVRRLGPLPVPEACSIVRMAASALQFAHEQKVIHRDVKPSNLMITADGVVKLLDLGLAQILELEGDDALSRADQVLGTLAYMSPEQLSGRRQVTPQSDIFSLGITFHELLTGQRPFDRPGMPPLVSDIRSVRPDVDENLSALVGDMIALTPSERPLTMTDVESRLNAISTAENLQALVAEYYRWDNRTLPISRSKFAKADTEAGSSRRPGRQPTAVLSSIASPVTAEHKSFWKDQNATQWIMGLAMACAVAAIFWYVAYPKPTGKVEVFAENLASDLLSKGSVVFKNIDTGDRVRVTERELVLPVGKYQPFYEGPDEFIHDGIDFEVFANVTNKLVLTPTFAKLFQFPDIPNRVGANATYHGSLWRKGWDEKANSVSFNIYMEVLAIEEKPDFPATKWLQLDVYADDGENDYRESAILNMDSKRWETGNALAINEGWIEADSSAIKRFMERLEKNNKLVVPFDRELDLLAENSDIPLPERRLSVQDVLSLFFGQDMPAAGKSINLARARLLSIGGRNDWIAPVNDGRSSVPCYIVSSRNQGEDKSTQGFMVARRRSGPLNPFGFVELEVNSPNLRVECRIKNAGAGPAEVDTGRIMRRIAALERNKFDSGSAIAMLQPAKIEPKMEVVSTYKPSIRKPSSSVKPIPPDPTGWRKWNSDWAFQFGSYLANTNPNTTRVGSTIVAAFESPPPLDPAPPKAIGRFDRAVVPTHFSFQVYTGTIFLNKDTKEAIRVTVKALDDEQFENRVYRWIEVDVTAKRENSPENREAARLLIDAATYNATGEFKIKRGWIAYGNKEAVFEISSDGNLESLVDLRLPIQHKIDLTRIGVTDVLSMLFNAELTPTTKISELRANFAGAIPGTTRRGMEIEKEHKSGKRLVGLLYKSPLDLATLNYSFFRSAQVPFGFVDVSLNAFDVKIGLETENSGSLGSGTETSPLFSNLASSGQLKSATSKPNWRVWTWKDAGKIYKAWAEFGGEIDTSNSSDVLLRDEAELEIRVPKNSLSESDIAFIDAGRIWPSIDTRRRVLVEDNTSTNAFVFRIPGNAQKEDRYRDFALKPIDIAWLNKLRDAKKLKPDRQKDILDWQSFAGYIK